MNKKIISFLASVNVVCLSYEQAQASEDPSRSGSVLRTIRMTREIETELRDIRDIYAGCRDRVLSYPGRLPKELEIEIFRPAQPKIEKLIIILQSLLPGHRFYTDTSGNFRAQYYTLERALIMLDSHPLKETLMGFAESIAGKIPPDQMPMSLTIRMDGGCGKAVSWKVKEAAPK